MKRTVRRFVLYLTPLIAAAAGTAQAVPVDIDLSGASSGTSISAPGATFGGYFSGQTQSGNTISGTPTGPLSVEPASNLLQVDSFNPGCTGCDAGNSILPQPSNQGPLAVLLDSDADSFELVMGFADTPSSIAIDLFANDGSLVASLSQSLNSGYNLYSLSGLGIFRGISFHSNTDSAGLRFMDMAYNSVTSTEVPEPGSLGLIGAGLLGLGVMQRRRRAR